MWKSSATRNIEKCSQLHFQRQTSPYQPAFVQMTSEFVRRKDIIFNFQNLLPAEISEVLPAAQKFLLKIPNLLKNGPKWPLPQQMRDRYFGSTKLNFGA